MKGNRPRHTDFATEVTGCLGRRCDGRLTKADRLVLGLNGRWTSGQARVLEHWRFVAANFRAHPSTGILAWRLMRLKFSHSDPKTCEENSTDR